MEKKTQFSIEFIISKKDIFYSIMNTIEPVEIPIEYIEKIIVYYHDGTIVELKADEIQFPIPINKYTDLEKLEEIFNKMEEIKIFINISKLKIKVNSQIQKLFK